MNHKMVKYTAAQKRAYYAKKRAMQKNKEEGIRYNRAKYYGHGKYTKKNGGYSARRIGKAVGAGIGSYIAPGIGTAIGSALGSGAGTLFKAITGYGDYVIKQNSLLNIGPVDESMASFGNGSVRIKHREYITSIGATTAFTNNSFNINPGLNESFPWLSTIAASFDQYKFHGLIFELVSTSSDAIASTTALGMGQVIAATDYDSLDAAFQNAPQMLNSMFSSSHKPNCDILHAVECAPKEQAQQLYYVRTGALPSGGDLRLSDLGVFQVATQNMPADYSGMAMLFVSYDVSLYKPVSDRSVGSDLSTDSFDLVIGNGTTPLGSSQTANAYNSIGCTVDSSANLNFPAGLEAGYFLIDWFVIGTPQTLTYPVLSGVNASVLTSTQLTSPIAGGSSARAMLSFVVKITGGNAKVEWGTSGTIPTSGTGTLRITQVNGDLYSSAT